MANTVTRTVLLNDNNYYVINFNILGDASGEASGVRINATTGDLGTSPKIKQIKGATFGCGGILLWDATTDVLALALPTDSRIDEDFLKLGYLTNTAGTGKTGDLLLTTVGLGANDAIDLEIWFTKV